MGDVYQPSWCQYVTVDPAHLQQIEQVSQLSALVHAQVEYHSRAAEILTQLSSKIDERLVLTPAVSLAVLFFLYGVGCTYNVEFEPCLNYYLPMQNYQGNRLW